MRHHACCNALHGARARARGKTLFASGTPALVADSGALSAPPRAPKRHEIVLFRHARRPPNRQPVAGLLKQHAGGGAASADERRGHDLQRWIV